MAGVKGRSGGMRPGAGRPRGKRNRSTLEREALVEEVLGSLKELVEITRHDRVRRINEFESLPAILRRLTAIERHLELRETHTTPRIGRRRPLGG